MYVTLFLQDLSPDIDLVIISLAILCFFLGRIIVTTGLLSFKATVKSLHKQEATQVANWFGVYSIFTLLRDFVVYVSISTFFTSQNLYKTLLFLQDGAVVFTQAFGNIILVIGTIASFFILSKYSYWLELVSKKEQDIPIITHLGRSKLLELIGHVFYFILALYFSLSYQLTPIDEETTIFYNILKLTPTQFIAHTTNHLIYVGIVLILVAILYQAYCDYLTFKSL